MKIFIGADHAGYELKNKLYHHLVHLGHEIVDVGAKTLESGDDYPTYAYAVAVKILGEEGDARGILACDSAEGVAMAANRLSGIRASVCWSAHVARETRADNDSNVLCLPGKYVDEETAFAITEQWLAEPFSGAERHIRRIKALDELV